jgi:hypothetical protein
LLSVKRPTVKHSFLNLSEGRPLLGNGPNSLRRREGRRRSNNNNNNNNKYGDWKISSTRL